MTLNRVTTNDYRFLFGGEQGEFFFMDVSWNPPWVSENKNLAFHNTTRDGINYAVEKDELLFGTFFFLSNTRVEYNR